MKVETLYSKLYSFFGPQHWWPAESPFEVIVGAILTQQTTWKNVEKAIANIKKRNLLFPEKLVKVELNTLCSLIKPTGFYLQKAKRLKNFVSYLVNSYDGSLDKMFNNKPVDKLRDELLSLNGIGKETADSILLYAGNKPIFPIDAYTFRVFERLNICPSKKEYDKVRLYVQKHLPLKIDIYKEFHALLVKLAKTYCKIKPLCNQCPLRLKCPTQINE